MHAVKIPFSGIKNLSIYPPPPKTLFLSQKPFFVKIEPFKKNFFILQSRVDSLEMATITCAKSAIYILDGTTETIYIKKSKQQNVQSG